MTFEEQVAPVALDIRPGGVGDLLKAVIGEQELARAARRARQPIVVLRAAERTIGRDRIQDLPAFVAPAVPELEPAQFDCRIAARRGAGERLELRACLRVLALEDVDERRGQVPRGGWARPCLRQTTGLGDLSVAERHTHLLDERIGGAALPAGLCVDCSGGRHERNGEREAARSDSN